MNFTWNPESRSYVDFDTGVELKRHEFYKYHYEGSDGNTYFLTSKGIWFCLEAKEDNPRNKK